MKTSGICLILLIAVAQFVAVSCPAQAYERKQANGLQIFASMPAKAPETGKEKTAAPPDPDRLQVFGDFSAEGNFWEVSFDKDKQIHPIVDYDTEGFAGYTGSLILGFSKESPLLKVVYSAPFHGTSNQKALIRQKDAGSGDFPEGMESLKYIGNLSTIRNLVGSQPAGLSRMAVNVISSIGFRHEKRHFFGKATALENILLVESGAYVDGNTLRGNLSPLDKGNQLSFHTTFERYEITTDIAQWGFPNRADKPMGELKVGYYHVSYRRPTDNASIQANLYNCGGCATGSRYYLIDADFESDGLTIGLGRWWSKPVDPNNKGSLENYSIKFAVDVGINDSVTVHNSNFNLYSGRQAKHVGLTFNLDYSRSGKINDRVSWVVGGIFDFDAHSWSSESANTSILRDRDMLYKAALRGGLSF